MTARHKLIVGKHMKDKYSYVQEKLKQKSDMVQRYTQ